jgi:SAM-dependent methyltransferase
MQSVAEAYVRGGCVDWKGFDRAQSRQVVALPTYPFERQKYWIEAPIERARPTWEEAVAAGSLQAQYAPLDLALETFPTKWAVLERLSRAYMVETLRSFGLFTKHGETLTVHQVVGTAGIQLIYTKLIERWLERLVDAKLLQRADAGFVATQPLTGEPVETVREEARLAFSDYPGLFEYVTLCGRELQSVLTGRQSALETLFPGGSTHLADEIYRTSGIAKYFNAIVRALVQSIARGASSLSILEIGAGTGSTTSLLLPELSAAGPRYSFTDVSQLFLARARARFAQYAFIDYGILDIEKSPAAQGYTEGAYDIVVAVNVLHATGDLEATLRNARALLASNGVLIMLETTAHPIWLEITTGLIEGWQKFADPLRASHPLLDRREWSTLLAGCGFTAVEAFPPEGAPTGLLGQHVIIARAPTRAGAPVPVAKFVRAPAGAELDGMVTAQSHESVDTLRARLETASIEGREDLLIELVCQEIGDVLGADARHRPQADERLHDFGVDSLMAVELRNRLVRRLALEQKLTATLIFDYPTPLAIARHLADLVFGSAGSHAVAEAAPSSELPRIDRAALESMGDDEAEALLASRLEQL